MSLLLDALKKAAEKKAAKGAQANTDASSAKEVGNDSGVPDDEVTKTVGITRTEYEDTEIAKTEFDATEHTNYEPTRYDSTELEATELDATQVDATVTTQYEPTSFDSAKTEHDVTEYTEDEAGRYDAENEGTDVDYAQLESGTTQYEPTHFEDTGSTQVESGGGQVGVPETNDSVHETTRLDTESAATSSDDIEYPDIQEPSPEPQSDPLQSDLIRDSSNSPDGISVELATVEKDSPQELNSEDETLYFQDDDALQEGANDEPSHAAINELTHDDVTEFMGDGLRDEVAPEAVPLRDSLSSLTSDDTTITNPDSLTLAQIDQRADELELIEKSYDTEGWDDGLNESDTISQSRDPVLDEYGQPVTIMGQETTSATVPPVDFDRLTTDETVTIKETTSTQTFAPDNYDRTLMKISDKDASKIFPGMKGDSDSVMTPDHAKRVFQSKSSSVKSYYFKLFSGIAAVLLVAILVVGLFQIQEEADEVDMTLLRYKRDPMPGVIKPKIEEKTDLFADQPIQTDEKVLEVLATAVSDGDLGAPLEQSDSSTVTDSVATTLDQVSTGEASGFPSKTSQQPAPIASKGALSVEVTQRVSDKDQLLQDAYQAYEEGDLERSRGLYDKVILLDQGNRDALLGRAAIFVHDEQFSEAIGIYQNLLVENPKDSMAMASLISVANIDFQFGETEIKKMLQEQPDSPYLHFALGNMYGGQQRWNEAQKSYFSALEQNPDDPNYAYNMAVSLEHLGKKSAARGFYQKALDNKGLGPATFDEMVVAQRIEVLAQ